MSNENWHQEETYKSLILNGNSAIRYVLIINGGAVIALLTFLGNLLKNSGHESIQMGWSMACFLFGILLGGAAHITAYFTQLALFNEQGHESRHMKWVYLSVVFVVLGMFLFGVGSTLALLELQSYT